MDGEGEIQHFQRDSWLQRNMKHQLKKIVRSRKVGKRKPHVIGESEVGVS